MTNKKGKIIEKDGLSDGITKAVNEALGNPHDDVKEKLDHQHAPEPDVEKEKVEEEIKQKIQVEDKPVEKWIRGKDEEDDVIEMEKVEEPVEEEEQGEEELSIKKQHELEEANKRKFDICPFCGTHAVEGAIQPKIPLPIGDQALLIALPLLICVRCTNAYMPRSFVQQLLQPETERPKIITP